METWVKDGLGAEINGVPYYHEFPAKKTDFKRFHAELTFDFYDEKALNEFLDKIK